VFNLPTVLPLPEPELNNHKKKMCTTQRGICWDFFLTNVCLDFFVQISKYKREDGETFQCQCDLFQSRKKYLKKMEIEKH
jgi:hypothetical protein